MTVLEEKTASQKSEKEVKWITSFRGRVIGYRKWFEDKKAEGVSPEINRQPQ